jgi:methionyl-tRNA formyltransferase
MSAPLRIVYMGTPEFAIPSLEALIKAGHDIVGVVTAPDKPAGHGMKLRPSPVKMFALQRGLRLHQPPKLKDSAFLEELRSLEADVFVVVAFRMLPESVWSMPRLGTVNLHASLLPDYRGAAPINWAVINGERETGLTTFQLTHEIDTGDILLQERMPIGPDESAGELHDRMMTAGAGLLVRTIQGLAEGTLKGTPQASLSAEMAHAAPKIHTGDCSIDFTHTANEVHNLVRGMSPFPGAFTKLNGKLLKLFRTAVVDARPTAGPGEYETDRKTFLRFACADGYVSVIELQWEGKRRMGVSDFLNGWRES